MRIKTFTAVLARSHKQKQKISLIRPIPSVQNVNNRS
jgi:hypothetical protein